MKVPRNERFTGELRSQREESNLDPWQRAGLGSRLREVREDVYGEFGAQFLADALGIPLQTWLNYEAGVLAPGAIVLQLQVITGVTAGWLLDGDGKKYDRRVASAF